MTYNSSVVDIWVQIYDGPKAKDSISAATMIQDEYRKYPYNRA